MEDKIQEESKVLFQKRKLIEDELKEKQRNLDNIENKLRLLSKEAKGTYNEEKETTEKIYKVLTKDIDIFREAISEPYFGRVDFREHRGVDDTIYIGKRGISNTNEGEEVVIDWRAPIADLYYSGTGGEASYKAPGGVINGTLKLKRKILFKDGDIKEIFDEGINELMINGEEGYGLVDEFLKINLEESRGKKLKEVVATIQKEQNDIIRWPKNLPIIVQGSAGSGKTTIALHRLAYLIYRYRDNMKGEEILVLAPNKLFLDYISDILPSLGAGEVKQETFEGIISSKFKIRGKIYNKDEKLKSIMEEKDKNKVDLIINASRLKGSLIFKEFIDRYITLIEGRALEVNDITIGGEILFSKKEIMRLYLKDLKNYPINKRKDEIKRYLNLKIKERMEQLVYKIDRDWEGRIQAIRNKDIHPDEKRKELIAIYDVRDSIKDDIKKNSKKVFNDYFKAWRGIDSKGIYYNFFNDEELFSIATDDRISTELSQFIREEYNKNYKDNIIDEDDLAALSYIRIILEGVQEKEKYEHIVVDEVQDYSPFQVYVINRLSKGNSLTLVGDLAQGIYYYKGIKKWEDITEGLFDGNATYIQLTQSYRSTVEIIDFAKGALEAQELGLKNALPVLRHGEIPKVIKANNSKSYGEVIDNIIEEVKSKGKNSIAIITKDGTEALNLSKIINNSSKNKFSLIKGKEKSMENNMIIIPSYLTKGLEFDCTIIFNPSDKNYNKNLLDERLLYVSLTRALHLEYIVEVDNLSELIDK